MLPRVGVFYGSHSGVCEGFARRLVGELRWRLKLDPCFKNLNEFSNPYSFSGYALFITSTYRQGSFPDNASVFWQKLEASPHNLNFNFSVFARGSTAYPTFNAAGRKLDKRLLELGATPFYHREEQDALSFEQDEHWYAWKESVIQRLASRLNIVQQPWTFTPNTRMTEIESPKGEKLHLANPANDRLFESKSRVNKIAASDRQYYEIDFPECRTEFKPGDHLVVWPENGEDEVAEFIKAVGLESKRNTYVEINGHHCASYEELARQYIGIGNRMQRELLSQLSHFAPNAITRERALRVASDFREFSRAPQTLGSLLLSLSDGQPWPVVPEYLLENLPYLSPRVYSISSCSTPSITVMAEGVATKYLSKSDGNYLTIAIRSNPSFHLPPSGVPILLICTGTGIAPFRAFCQAHEGDKYVFYGCRTPQEQLYRHEKWPDTTVIPAFSRWGSASYVHDKLKKHSDLVWDLLDRGAYVYVCGDVRKLRLQSRLTLIHIMASKLGEKRAEAEFKSLKKSGRIKMDLW